MALGQAELGISKPVSFPTYRRSHFRSQTYLTLVCILSHLSATPDHGSGTVEQEKPEKGLEFSESVASMDPRDPVPEKMTQEVDETRKWVGDKGRGESGTNDVVLRDIEQILGIEEVEDPLRRKLEDLSEKNDFNEQQRIMNDLELAVEGTEDLLYNSGLISFNLGLGEKQDGRSEVDLMDYQVEHIEFQHSDVNKSGTASDLQVQGEFMTTKVGEFEKEEQCCPKVAETKEDMEEGELISNSSNTLVEKGDIEEGGLSGNFGMDGEYCSVPKPENIKDSEIGSKVVTHKLANFARNQVLYTELWEEDANQDHGNSLASKQKVDVSSKKKRGPGNEKRKAKRKEKKRKKRAEKNKQLGVKRLKLTPMQKPKTIAYCRHYLVGRCHEGDKCKFSHDTEPQTKSTPCRYFARLSCMKGDDCPFDHQLSKYPCNNLVTNGFCSRGDACLFSHQLPTKEDTPTPSKVCRPELKSPLPSGHTSSVHKVTDTIQKQLTAAPKGINFINIAESPLPSSSAPKQGMITPDKDGPVQIGTCADQSASGTNQTLVDVPKKLPAVAPEGVNFLSFGNGSVCGFGSSSSSSLDSENGIKLPQFQFASFGSPYNASSSLKKDGCRKAMDGTKPSLLKSDRASHKFSGKNQFMTGVKLIFPGKASINDARIDLQGRSYSRVDHNRSKSVQEAKMASNNSETSSATPSMSVVSRFGLHRTSECLPFRNQEHTSNSDQNSLLSTLAFAVEHGSGIMLKDSTGASPIRTEDNIDNNKAV